MGKTLKERIRRTVLGAGLIASLGIAGCGPGDFIGLGNMLNGVEANEAYRARTASQEGQYRLQPQNREVPKPWPKAFVCNYLKDINEDGRIAYPDEIVGEKRKFTLKEQITFVRGPEGEGNFIFKVFDGEGRLLGEYNDGLNKKMGDFHAKAYQPGALKPGTYLMVWYNGEKADGSSQIEVVNE